MKGLFRIDEYLPDTQQIIVRFCGSHSQKSIEDYAPFAMDLSSLDMNDCDTFVETLMMKGTSIIKEQDNEDPVTNSGECISGELDLESLIGKVIEAKLETYRKGPINMRKVEL